MTKATRPPNAQLPAAKPSLDGLAKAINAAHAEAGRMFQAGVGHAIECGELLLKARALVPPGGWEAWVKTHTNLSPRSCSGYMRLARLPDRQRVADSGVPLREALRALAGEGTKRATATSQRRASAAARTKSMKPLALERELERIRRQTGIDKGDGDLGLLRQEPQYQARQSKIDALRAEGEELIEGANDMQRRLEHDLRAELERRSNQPPALPALNGAITLRERPL
jgi:hypothetical protein